METTPAVISIAVSHESEADRYQAAFEAIYRFVFDHDELRVHAAPLTRELTVITIVAPQMPSALLALLEALRIQRLIVAYTVRNATPEEERGRILAESEASYE